MACINSRKLPTSWLHKQFSTVLVFCIILNVIPAKGQLDLPPISSSPRPGDYYNGPSTARPYDRDPRLNQPFSSSARPDLYSSTPRYQDYNNRGITPDITNNGFPDTRDRNYDPRYNNPDQLDRTNDPRYNTARPDLSNDPRYNPEIGFNYNRNQYGENHAALNKFLSEVDVQASEECSNNVAAQWNFETDVNEVTQLAALDAQQRYALFQRGLWQLISGVGRQRVVDPNIWRQLRYMSVIGPSALPPDQLDRYNRLINDMLAVYNGAEICAYNEPFKCGLRLQPHLTTIMARSRDWDELQHVWTEWRRHTGLKFRDLYEQLVDLTNQAAKLNNFTSAAEYWTFPFESARFKQDVEDVWEQIRPLYEQLHAYVRRKLRDLHGPERISRSAPLPAHVLGNMWGQSWTNILDITIPYPGKSFLDVTPEMQQQGYTPLTLFQLAEEFFVSMNMSALPPSFWEGSILERPPDRNINCQPSAWDFCNGQDFRIKMCTEVSMKDLVTAHHEVGHIQYFLQYSNKPKIYRDGANPGFHEAIGEAIALSVSSPRHLQTLGLVQKSVDDLAHDTNYLFAQAMDKLPFLPFALTMDRWRWDVFNKDIRKEQYNCHWWRLREQYSGVKPPVLRSEMDFDPGSKYHVPANIPYIRYFVSTVLQFQIHRAMCRASGQYVPGDPDRTLHKCDIYRSPQAGKVLSDIMKQGSAFPWTKVLFDATGDYQLDGEALREYFRPLEEWLRNENLRTNEYVGWIYDGDYCKYSIETAGLQVYGGFYNSAHSVFSIQTMWTLFIASFLTSFITFYKYR